MYHPNIQKRIQPRESFIHFITDSIQILVNMKLTKDYNGIRLYLDVIIIFNVDAYEHRGRQLNCIKIVKTDPNSANRRVSLYSKHMCQLQIHFGSHYRKQYR